MPMSDCSSRNHSVFDRQPSVDNAETRIVYGRNPVKELVENSKNIDRLVVKRGEKDGSINVIISLARSKGIAITEADTKKLDMYSSGGKHQGVIAFLTPIEFLTLDQLLASTSESGLDPFYLILDGVEDPQNLGAILRSAVCAGANGVILPKHHCAPLTAAACKASAGAVEYIPIAKVTNLVNAIETLKRSGVWIFGADANGELYDETDLSGPIAVVLGSEGYGISRLVKEKCDKIVSIPLHGAINSLNVSAAAAVLLYAAEKNRRN